VVSDAVVMPSARAEPGTHERCKRAWDILRGVNDPEVPVISVVDLGIVRDVTVEGGELVVAVTPTYSGCPATEAIEESIVAALDAAGLGPTRIRMQRAPAWTSDWISAEGRAKLHAYGIAPPGPVDRQAAVPLRFVARAPAPLACPRCASTNTERIAAFGATACKALWRCRACGEPFEHFKPI
jgi:ring-1,2-phenylacetyl-CoA epoxidase subunit PaaD